MSATPYEPPLRAVPPLADQQERMGLLLQARRLARRAAEAARTMAVRVMDALADPKLLRQAISRLHEAALRIGRPVTAGLQWLGRRGGLAAVAAVVTSGTGRQVLADVGRTIGGAVASAATTVGSLIDGGLRRLGSVGNRAADWLVTSITGLRRRLQPVVTATFWVARATDPNSPLGRLVSSVSRSYLLHRLLRVAVSNRWLRAVVEVVMIPAIADNAAVAWLRRVLAQARVRAEHLHDEADVVADPQATAPENEAPRFVAGDEVHDDTQQDPGPVNRAERRAANKRRNQGPQQ